MRVFGKLLLIPLIIAALSGCASEDYTELMSAANLGDVDGMKRIMERGGNVNDISRNGKTALLLASSQGHLKAVYLLIARGAEVNIPDGNGTTPLIAAATNGHDKVVQLLLKNGAQLDTRDRNSNSAFRNAVFFRYSDTVAALLEYQSSIPADEQAEGLLTAAALGYTEILELMVKAKLDINQPGVRNRTAIMAAIEFDQAEVVKYLLAKGADLSVTDQDQNTALDIAREKGNQEILALLEKKQ